ncbi:MAG TPA: S8 family serine peptidase [Candidatus Limnocylindria bacterium]|nr:S8 family serine peptidase [Candidatus Limnocylindria bacterium]
MKRAIAVFAMILLLPIAGPTAVLARDANAAPAPGRATDWIVTIQRGLDVRTVAPALAKQAGGKAGRVYEHALRGFVFHGSAKAAAALKRAAGVRTVVPDRPLKIVAETLTPGIERIRADHPTANDAHQAGFTGAGARVAVIDTGIDLTHPDLVAGIDAALGLNCITAGPPQDGHGHGTHVAGIIGARAGNGIGVIGVAPNVRLVAIKALNDQGEGNWSNVICGIDYVTGLATDGDPSNDVDVVNMSLGDTGDVGNCNDGGLREAICRSVAAGVVYVAAAGNSATDASTFIPAAFPEVITVSAMTDFDGEPGGLAGCQFLIELFYFACDDELAFFSNYGSAIDVTAPGVAVYSTWTGGGYKSISGTSMAAPHVAGVAALVRAANQSLTPTQIETLLERTGELPDGSSAAPGCGSGTQWGGDPDGIAEPLVNALNAVLDSAGASLPTVTLTPADGSNVNGTVTLSALASHPSGIANVQFLVDGASIGIDASAPYQATWDTLSTFDGAHSISARATATTGEYSCQTNAVTTGADIKGNWVGTYGADGFALAGWNDTSPTGDLVVLPNATLTVEQGDRYVWANPTTDVRALESPYETERRAATWFHDSQLRLRLNFSAAYAGTLHLYVVDFDTTTRRQNVTVTDGTTTKTIAMTSSYSAGAWLHFPINVGAGGIVRITADYVAGFNPNIDGLFLGGPGAPPIPPPPPPSEVDSPGVQGNWVGTYGTDGYALGAWNGSTDLVVLPTATLTMEQGRRHTWANSTTDVRALQSPGQTERRAATWVDDSQLRLRLDFSAAYSGNLHLYVVDWDSTTRRQNVTVSDGTTTKTIAMTNSYSAGAWLHFPITVGAGGIVRITADYVAGYNPNIDGLFLGGAGPLPPPPGDWVGVYGADGYALGAWNSSTDLVALPNATLTVEQGSRYVWANPTTDVRALESPNETERRAATWFDNSQLRLRLNFSAAYAGTLHLYVVDWDSTTRRQNVTVTDGTTTRTIAMTSSYNAGAWLHFPINVGAGGIVRITADYVAGYNPNIDGLFLGGAGSSATVPGQPVLSATGGTGQVTLGWTTPASGGSPISGYRLYRGTSSGSLAPYQTLGLVTAYTDTSVSNGTTYYYQVSAVNTIGEGSRSTERSATPVAPASLPSAPLGLSASQSFPKGIDLAWTAPASNGGSAITDYRIYRSTTTGTETLLVTVTGGTTSYRDTATKKGTLYFYVVRAVNAVGEGPSSGEASAVAR